MLEATAGGCQCGAVRYTVSGALPPAYCCHCGECKKQSASAFSMSTSVESRRLETKGRAAAIEPREHLWVSKKQPSITLRPAILAFDTQPEDVQAWRTSLR